jgi:hypothetical protein
MAVIAELARDAMAEVDALLSALQPAGLDAASIEQAVDRAIDIVLAGYNEVPARQRLFTRIRGNATLEPILRDSDNRMVDVLAHNIKAIRPDLPQLQARAIAQTTVATFTALQDNVVGCQNEPYAKTLIAEWRRIVKGYLALLAVE